eukprot:g42057.t1
MTGADNSWMDHFLIQARINANVVPPQRTQQKPCRKKFNIEALKDLERKASNNQLLSTKLVTLSDTNLQDSNSFSSTLKAAIIRARKISVSHSTRKHQDWFDENGQQIQEVMSQDHMTITFGPNTQGPTLPLAMDGVTHTKDKETIKQSWGKHFRHLLSQGSVIDPSVFEHIPLHATCRKLSNTPALHKVEKAVSQLKNNKAAGADGIPAEALKCRNKELLLQLCSLTCLIWKEESIPGQLRDATVLEEHSGPGSIRGAEKLTFRVGTHLQYLYMAFLNLTKVFDTVNYKALWNILLHIGCTITTLRLVHNDMEVGSETWTVYSRHLEAVEQNHQCCLRKIRRIHREERHTNTSVLDQADIPSIEALTTFDWLRWAGYVIYTTDTS